MGGGAIRAGFEHIKKQKLRQKEGQREREREIQGLMHKLDLEK